MGFEEFGGVGDDAGFKFAQAGSAGEVIGDYLLDSRAGSIGVFATACPVAKCDYFKLEWPAGISYFVAGFYRAAVYDFAENALVRHDAFSDLLEDGAFVTVTFFADLCYFKLYFAGCEGIEQGGAAYVDALGGEILCEGAVCDVGFHLLAEGFDLFGSEDAYLAVPVACVGVTDDAGFVDGDLIDGGFDDAFFLGGVERDYFSGIRVHLWSSPRDGCFRYSYSCRRLCTCRKW